jgi:hypothetical protein
MNENLLLAVLTIKNSFADHVHGDLVMFACALIPTLKVTSFYDQQPSSSDQIVIWKAFHVYLSMREILNGDGGRLKEKKTTCDGNDCLFTNAWLQDVRSFVVSTFRELQLPSQAGDICIVCALARASFRRTKI